MTLRIEGFTDVTPLAGGGFGLESATGINRTGSAKFRLFNLLTFGRFADMGCLQYACVARPRET